MYGSGTTTEPNSFDHMEASKLLCLRGNVRAKPDYDSGAEIQINLDQEGNRNGSYVPAGDGLRFVIQNHLGSSLRVLLFSALQADLWCANVEGKSGFMPWTHFNTKCWDDSGVPYAHQPLRAVGMLTPGSNTADVPFGFCVEHLGEAVAP